MRYDTVAILACFLRPDLSPEHLFWTTTAMPASTKKEIVLCHAIQKYAVKKRATSSGDVASASITTSVGRGGPRRCTKQIVLAVRTCLSG